MQRGCSHDLNNGGDGFYPPHQLAGNPTGTGANKGTIVLGTLQKEMRFLHVAGFKGEGAFVSCAFVHPDGERL
ncbi:hypothetical protein OBV_01540 [Oscillibacter valericigenes Sjm18-20]|nr:hypothetical protein OBV_01540 [Oscillibacter valericigenes Sjm18-20]